MIGNSNALDQVAIGLAEYGPSAAVGVTVVLAGGLLLARSHRAAEARRRLGIWTAIGALAYLLLALPPLPRLLPEPAASSGVRVASPAAGDGPSAPATAGPGTGAAGAERSNAGGPPLARSIIGGPELDGATLDATKRDAEGPGEVNRDRAESAAPTRNPLPVAVLPYTPVLAANERLTRLLARANELDVEVAAPTARTPDPSAPQWARALTITAFVAVILLLGHYTIGAWRLRRILRRCRPAAAAVAAVAANVQLPAGTRVLVARDAVRPFCAGWLRPVVVLSPELGARPESCAAVLRHEAAHLFGRDPLVQLLFAVLALPLALHPLFWWLRATVRFDSERVADERAARSGPSRTDYVRDLLDLVDVTAAPPARGAATMAVFHRRSTFYRRIQMLLSTDTVSTPVSRPRRALQAVSLGALVATAALTFGVPAAAQGPGAAARKARLEAERAALRAEIHALRAELEEMREQMDRNAARRAPGQATRQGNAPTTTLYPSGHANSQGSAPATTRYPSGQALKGANSATQGSQNIAAPPKAPTLGSTTQPPQPLARATHPDFSGQGGYPAATRAPTATTAPAARSSRPDRKRAPLARTVFQDTDNDGLPDTRLVPAAPSAPAANPLTAPVPTAPSRWNTTPGLPAPGNSHLARTARQPSLPTGVAAPPARSTTAASMEEIVTLTSKLLDLDSDLHAARAKQSDSKKLVKEGYISKSEARADALRLKNLERKYAILRGLLDGEINATKLELDWLQQQMDRAGKNQKVHYQIGMQRAMSRLEALQIAK